MIEPVARIRIILRDANPQIWRLLDVPLSATLLSLHDLIQIAMGWTGNHLFAFGVGSRRYGTPDPVQVKGHPRIFQAERVHVRTIIERGLKTFSYVYDFGDNWIHDCTIEGCRVGDDATDYPAFVGGAGRCPPEDVGGISGFDEFLVAVADPGHPDHRRMIRWYGKPYDPRDINEGHVRQVFEALAIRRRGPLSSHRKSRRQRLNA